MSRNELEGLIVKTIAVVLVIAAVAAVVYVSVSSTVRENNQRIEELSR